MATPFPRKSRPCSDEKCLPQSAPQLQPQSLTRLTTLCLFVERSLSNVCANGRAVTITGTEARDFLSKIESHVRSSEAKHPADLRRPQEVCNSSIQKNDPSALKPLGVRYRTASGSDRPGYAVVSTALGLAWRHTSSRDDCVPKAGRYRSRFCNDSEWF